jgi:regulator of ribonuclease activity A
MAVTIKCYEDNSRVREAVATPGEDELLVIDSGGSCRCALVGDMLAS